MKKKKQRETEGLICKRMNIKPQWNALNTNTIKDKRSPLKNEGRECPQWEKWH